MKKVLVIGSLNMDMVLGVDAMPLSGETVAGNSFQTSAGGKGANQAGALGKLGASPVMLGCVGNDSFGNELIEELTKSGVDTARIRKSADKPTGIAVIYVDKNGANSIVVISGANSDCDVDYLKANDDAFLACDSILLQMEIPREAVYYAIRRGAQLGKAVVLNPAPAPDGIPHEILNMAGYITPNETELARLTGRPCESADGIIAAARELESGIDGSVLVTMGKNGALYVSGGEAETFPSVRVPVADTTAAGDCFNAAFVLSLAEGRSPRQAIVFANAAAALSVSKPGALCSLPARAEVEAMLKTGKYAG